MLRQKVEDILKELDSGKLLVNTEILIRQILVASVEAYEDPDLAACGLRFAFDDVLSDPDSPTVLRP